MISALAGDSLRNYPTSPFLDSFLLADDTLEMAWKLHGLGVRCAYWVGCSLDRSVASLRMAKDFRATQSGSPVLTCRRGIVRGRARPCAGVRE
jgi:hypothetical protein